MNDLASWLEPKLTEDVRKTRPQGSGAQTTRPSRGPPWLMVTATCGRGRSQASKAPLGRIDWLAAAARHPKLKVSSVKAAIVLAKWVDGTTGIAWRSIENLAVDLVASAGPLSTRSPNWSRRAFWPSMSVAAAAVDKNGEGKGSLRTLPNGAQACTLSRTNTVHDFARTWEGSQNIRQEFAEDRQAFESYCRAMISDAARAYSTESERHHTDDVAPRDFTVG